MSLITPILILIILFFIENLYFKIADRYNIIDKPNHRSSHTKITIRGGGIIFAIAMLLYPFFFGLEYVYFLTGVLIISFISFLDDLKPISNKIRISFHFIAVALMFYQLEVFQFPFYIIIPALIVTIGTINAINFMDGINGITGAYALITLVSLWYINEYKVVFTSTNLIITAALAVFVFNFFNFRTKAKCFAGDVGSVSIAFILLFFIGSLIIRTSNIVYILLLLLYGMDSMTTIIFRLLRKEDIFEAHRSHYYQYLANEKKIPHIYVAISYAVVQWVINIVAVLLLKDSFMLISCFVASCLLAFIALRFWTEGSARLLK
ncbi:MraY family glycosyltransferase [Pedobacter sp. PWIIR3]